MKGHGSKYDRSVIQQAIIAIVSAVLSGSALGQDGDPKSSPWPAHVRVIELADGVEVAGDLKEGSRLHLGWADDSSVACWPGNENTNFQGNHVLFATREPQAERSRLSVTVQPEAGVDVSVYIYQLGVDRTYLPPDLPYAVTCEAAYDYVSNSNPGKPETTRVVDAINNKYNVIIGVAGANGHTSGEFKLTLHYQQ